ncbi:MAG: heavy metal translocating P-type ATPase [Hydrogenovibrio sp.]|uniref:heavy metal translocating P-type ATPase n=1 Tax=Hydrogenovibrio sp. TaxID=2065821 RepID=UPI0028702974|nr:heavy metal translocating P-type ATPase [Hydrogenovibrio sp.]MDR9498898.1 heavy metal translocating P-type ATPase [Hydrogenovibrio sp.]
MHAHSDSSHSHHNHDSHHNHHDHSKHHDHTEHHRMMIRDFRQRFWVSLLLTLPVLLLSPMVQGLLGFQFQFPFSDWVLFALGAAVYFYGGWPFLTGLKSELQNKAPGMMTLIGVAITVAFAYSAATVLGLEGKTFFWELVTLIDIMLLGHWIEMRSVINASKSLQTLVAMLPTEARKLGQDGTTQDVPVDELKPGDQVRIQPGEKIPVDGEVVEGKSSVNEAMVTGESKPTTKETGQKVIGGTLNGNGSLTVAVQQVGEQAYLNKVIQMVHQAQEKKSKAQNLADRIAFWLTIIALTTGFATLIAWVSLGQTLVFALERMASVMVITCPHALGLAVPLVVANSISMSARNGLLIRNRTAFEDTRRITTIAFDKTGTLTKGTFGVTQCQSVADEWSDDDLLKLAAAAEARSEHPIAAAVVEEAHRREMTLPEAKDFSSSPGEGVEAQVEGKKVQVVGPGYLQAHRIRWPQPDQQNASENKHATETRVFVLIDDQPAGSIALDDEIREDAFAAVKALKAMGIRVCMMTGDNEEVARKVSETLQLDAYYAGLLPDQKLEKIHEFQQQGEFVAMTGDGINDAPALAAADVGIAVGSGTDVAAETADIILVDSNPLSVVGLIGFGQSTHRKMIQNFVWATGYNVVAIPLAAGVLYQQGILISPALGAILMSLSTVIVAINAQLLTFPKEKQSQAN